MKIIFCIYQLDFADHISLSYLSAVAKKRGYKTFFCLLKDLEQTIQRVKPDLIAFSLNVFGFDECIKEHKRLVKKYKYFSIGGGPQATFKPELFETTELDAYCIGEGELAFDEFLKCLETFTSYDNVENLITLNASNPVRPLIKDLDTIPFPDRDLVLSNSFLGNISKKTFYTTRGCPFSCYYCANNIYNEMYRGKGKIVRRFSVDRIMNEIHYVKDRYRTEFVKFGDDVFALNADAWLEEFSKRYKKEINIPFNCYLRLDNVNEDLLKLLKESNCYSVHLSVDSVSPKVREEIFGRKMKDINIVKTLQLIKNYDIHTWVNFMLAAPQSTIEDDLNVIELSHAGDVTYTACSTTVPMNGTRLYDYSLNNNLIDSSYIGDMCDCSKRSPYKHFNEKEKDIRYNVWLLGPIASKLCFPFRQIVTFMIKHIKPNKLFSLVRDKYYKYSIENTIFKVK